MMKTINDINVSGIRPMKLSVVSVFDVSYNEFDRFMNETFGVKNYEVVAAEECGNDTVLRFDVSNVPTSAALDEWDQKKLDAFVATNGSEPYITYTLMRFLVSIGRLNAGVYNVLPQ